MKIIHISDTHQNFPKDLPEADVLVHTGDYSFLAKFEKEDEQITELKEFNEYLGTMSSKFDTILFTPGNHDFLFQNNPKLAKELLSNATLLLDSGIEINGVKFYGTPSQPPFFNWAFNDKDDIREARYKAIPDDTDVLLTHCPPHEILDLVSNRSYSKGQHVGCSILRYQVENRIKPKLHCFGHIHEQPYRTIDKGNTTFSNACIMDDSYEPNGTYNLMILEE